MCPARQTEKVPVTCDDAIVAPGSVRWHRASSGGDSVVGSQLALPIGVVDDGEIRLYRITLPYTPPSKNKFDGWPNEWKRAAKKKWERKIIEECRALMIPNTRTVGLAATLVFPTAARRDTQNYAQALWHWVPDALIKAGVIDDDTPTYLDIGPNWGVTFAVDSRKVDKKFRSRTHLAITMLVPAHLKEIV